MLRGPIVIATVKGDIHDIGKNIVRALLENYGFKVVDLGRDVPPEKIVETAIGVNATTVVLAHNHPSGVALPSPEDIQTTRRVAMALQAVEIVLVDHIIVADDDYVSIAQSDERFNQCLLL